MREEHPEVGTVQTGLVGTRGDSAPPRLVTGAIPCPNGLPAALPCQPIPQAGWQRALQPAPTLPAAVTTHLGSKLVASPCHLGRLQQLGFGLGRKPL